MDFIFSTQSNRVQNTHLLHEQIHRNGDQNKVIKNLLPLVGAWAWKCLHIFLATAWVYVCDS